jgi:hypothetical protein
MLSEDATKNQFFSHKSVILPRPDGHSIKSSLVMFFLSANRAPKINNEAVLDI